jgi:ATP-binding cassette subfamily B protein
VLATARRCGCDRVLVRDAGQVVEDGSPADLIADTDRFADLHRAWADSLV